MSTKFCKRGDHNVPVDKFSTSSRTSDGLFSWCKPCMASYEKERYANGDKIRKAENKAKTLKRNQDYLWSILEVSSCIDCENSDPRVLQFDHVDPSEKEIDVTSMLYDYSIENIDKEIAKCVVRCANCHTIRTSEQFGFWRHFR